MWDVINIVNDHEIITLDMIITGKEVILYSFLNIYIYIYNVMDIYLFVWIIFCKERYYM